MKFLFIVNPKSGTTTKESIINSIHRYLPVEDFKIIYWNNPLQDIEQDIKRNLPGFDVVVAVGGDGTVNLVARALINTKAALAIIPSGSGNGLARYLGIPLEINKAIKALVSGKTITIDTCEVNDMKFISTCGVGFDAYVSARFAHSVNRGFWSYARIIFQNFWKYKFEEYELLVNKTSISRKAFLITFANSNQFGNNAVIAPHADIQDGIMDIIIVKPFPFYKLFSMGIKLFNKTIHHSKYVETLQVQSVTLTRAKPGAVQYDGEPINMEEVLDVRIVPESLKVLIPLN